MEYIVWWMKTTNRYCQKGIDSIYMQCYKICLIDYLDYFQYSLQSIQIWKKRTHTTQLAAPYPSLFSVTRFIVHQTKQRRNFKRWGRDHSLFKKNANSYAQEGGGEPTIKHSTKSCVPPVGQTYIDQILNLLSFRYILHLKW